MPLTPKTINDIQVSGRLDIIRVLIITFDEHLAICLSGLLLCTILFDLLRVFILSEYISRSVTEAIRNIPYQKVDEQLSMPCQR